MNEIIIYFEFKDFYEFYKTLDRENKRHLRIKIAKFCRLTSEQQVRNWLSQKSIPFIQTDRVTKAVKQFAPVINMDPDQVTEKKLFPSYSGLIEEYSISEINLK